MNKHQYTIEAKKRGDVKSRHRSEFVDENLVNLPGVYFLNDLDQREQIVFQVKFGD
ncbi:heat shock protein 90 [Lyngbya sp. PCC 8106]|nr:heat shock protein 90 [Lyngbya sp. PCC 8106]